MSWRDTKDFVLFTAWFVGIIATGVIGGMFLVVLVDPSASAKCECVPAMKCRCQLCLESDKRPREIWIDEKDGPQPMTPEEFEGLQKRLRMQKQIDIDFREWMSENRPELEQPPEGQRWQPYYDIWIGKHWRDYPGFWDAAGGK